MNTPNPVESPESEDDIHFGPTCRVDVLLSEARQRGVYPVPDLTDREHQVLDTTLRGLQSREAAAVLGVSYKTVELHRARILKKFGAGTTMRLFALLVGTIRLVEQPAPTETTPG